MSWATAFGGNRGMDDVDYSDIDTWAVEVVVYEHKWMALPLAERVVAAVTLADKGWLPQRIANLLRVSDRAVYRYIKAAERNGVLPLGATPAPVMACHKVRVVCHRDGLRCETWPVGQAMGDSGLRAVGLARRCG